MTSTTRTLPTKSDIKKSTDPLNQEGRHIEAGWQSFYRMAFKKTYSEQDLDALRTLFFAGAHFTVGLLDPPHEDIVYNMKQELIAFFNEYKRKNNL